ncbi:MAG: 30S ribosomal protein S4e [Candidatus Thermoplasmatota archaeon]|nr:30S ribosomal protein S4e [Candidatus Thermoplasmatota archaeon]
MSHMKRVTVPRTWPVERKTHKWSLHPSLGPHPIEQSIPLAFVLRDYLGYADTAAEARHIIASREVMVDGVVRTDPRFPCGLMDVISFPTANEQYRVLIDAKGTIRLVPINADDATWKLCRVQNKTTIKGGAVQLNLHDGRNCPAEQEYGTGDVVKLAVPDQEILETFPLAPGSIALVTNGKHAGEIATVTAVETTRSSRPNVVKLEEFSTIEPYVFVIGTEKALVTLPEVSLYE